MLAATWPTSSLSVPRTVMRFGAGTSKLMPSGACDLDGVAEAEREVDGCLARGSGAVADADDLELLGEAVGHADDHVVDQRAHETVHGPVLPFVVGTLDDERVVVLADR